MKKPIVIAVVSVSVMVASRVLMGLLALLSGKASLLGVFLPVLLAGLILVGIVKGHRLAWQWGRMLGLVGGILLTLMAVAALARSGEGSGWTIAATLLAFQGVPLFPMFFALGTVEAREHFRVICPQCGNTKVKGRDFLFTKATCRRCNATWD